jgi:hypothetical protein
MVTSQMLGGVKSQPWDLFQVRLIMVVGLTLRFSACGPARGVNRSQSSWIESETIRCISFVDASLDSLRFAGFCLRILQTACASSLHAKIRAGPLIFTQTLLIWQLLDKLPAQFFEMLVVHALELKLSGRSGGLLINCLCKWPFQNVYQFDKWL